jgi:uncharacterized protein (TIGR02996 family)
MSEHQTLRQACLDDPEDSQLPLIYADWLEDHGDPERAAYIRAKVAYERLEELDLYDDELLDSWGYHARLLRERLPQHLSDRVRSLDWQNGTQAHASMNVADFLTLGAARLGVKAPVAAAFAQDGMRAAIGGTDGQILVWDLGD